MNSERFPTGAHDRHLAEGREVEAPATLMDALTVKYPWVQMILDEEKVGERRGWMTKFRGDFLLCSGKELDLAAAVDDDAAKKLLYGYALAVVELYDCRLMTPEDSPLTCCVYEPGAYIFLLRNVRPLLKPFQVRGMPGFFKVEVPDEMLKVEL